MKRLLPIALIVLALAGGAAAAETGAVPPCGTTPVPDYAAVDAHPAVQVISGNDLAAWKPAPCIGWKAKDDGVLVALAGRFHFNGTTDELLKRFGAISSLKGLQYWSVTDGGWRTLIDSASALDSPDSGHSRADFTLAEMKSGHDLYFAQQDNRTSEEVVYRMKVSDLSADGFVVAVENVTPVRSFMLTLFDPGDLQSVHFVERESPGVFRFYGLAFAGESLASSLALPEASYVNRALALYGHLSGKPGGARREVTRLRPLETRRGPRDRARELVVGELDIHRRDVLLEMLDLRGAGDRQHHRAPLQHPGESDLARRGAMRLGDACRGSSPPWRARRPRADTTG